MNEIDDCQLSIADWRGAPGSSRELPHHHSNQERLQAHQSTEFDNRQSTIVNPFEGHELWADCYDEAPNPLLDLERRRLAQILPDLTGSNIADLGCGTGRWLRQLVRQRPKQCVGVDFSPAMLRRAQANPELRSLLIQAKLPQIPLRTESMDFVLCSFVLGYVQELSLCAQDLCRILKRGGRLFCTDLHPATQELGWKRSFRKGDQIIEIHSPSRSVEEVSACFNSYFEPAVPKALFLSDRERPIFERAGKLELFEQARCFPAVIVFEWRKPRSFSTRSCFSNLAAG